MAKETNHRRKSKVERKVEELDVEALTKELVKPKPQPRKPKYDKKDRREPQQGDKRKDFKQKPKQNNQNNNKKDEKNQKNDNKKPYNKNKKNFKPKNNKGDSKWVPFFFGVYHLTSNIILVSSVVSQ
mgnify:CR=1 FL=1